MKQGTIIWDDISEPQSRAHILPAKSIEWGTPQWLYDDLNQEFNFTVDVASTHENAKCKIHYTKVDNVFAENLQGETIWCNPPYDIDMLDVFTKFLWRQTRQDNTLAVMLVPVKSDQAWWHNYVLLSEVRFIRGRIKFQGAKSGCPMAVCLVIMQRNRLPIMKSYAGPQRELKL